jgi:NAD(P)-dependent dehydrogenase (short-subunit alcohol dehydrogenase family)
MSHRLAGKVVVVTGAAGGQGAADAIALAAEGAQVIAVDAAEHPAPEVSALDYHRTDITDATAWDSLAAVIANEHGVLHGLVNNAGVTWRARLLDLAVDDLRRVMDVNLIGALLAMQRLVPLMTDGGSIVNIGSVAALTAHFPVAYTTSKWALRGLSQAAALELGQAGIRVNLVHPGYIDTPMTASASPAFRAANIAETPLGRTGSVEEIAPLIVYLISDESSFVTGAEIAVDGGLTAHGGVKSISDAMRTGPGRLADPR